MPGTIELSILDSEAITTSTLLKVTMGKRVYQSTGERDLSFPVVSLIGNMTVILQDDDGNEILRTEFRTISVVEKGLLMDYFPLIGGGSIRMKLQFSLSQEEHIRIRKVRETVLKRKRSEQIKTVNKNSASVAEENSPTKSEPNTTDKSEPTHVELLQVPEEKRKYQAKERSVLVPEKKTNSNQVSSSVRRMISAFEGPRVLGQRSNGVRTKNNVSYEENDVIEAKLSQTIAKSYSSGMLSDIQPQQKFVRPNLSRKESLAEESKSKDTGIHEVNVVNGPNVGQTEERENETYSFFTDTKMSTSVQESSLREEVARKVEHGIISQISDENIDIWGSRRICITTGGKKLRDLAELDTSSSDTVIDDKHIQHYDASAEVNHDKSVGVPRLYGGLIEQGVRIAIVFVACGALLFNTRQR